MPPIPARVRELTARVTLALAAGAFITPASSLGAQDAEPERGVQMSGLIFGNFQYHVEPGPDAATDEQLRAGMDRSQFALERVYLTARAAMDERSSARVTAEMYNGASGYQMRVKYAYLNHVFAGKRAGNAYLRAGLLQNIMVDHEERFWPRFVGTAPLTRAGYFSAADLGVAVGAELPGNWGEVYAEVVDGRGHAALGRADDQFRDYAARVTLTPFAGSAGAWRALVVSPWYYRGDTASVFGPGSDRDDTPGYLGPSSEGRQRDRYGLFMAWDDPRLTAGASVARRRSVIEGGENTTTSPITTGTVTGTLASAFVVARPLAFMDSSGTSPFALALRYDRHDPDRDAPGSIRHVVVGLIYDVSPSISLALDYQETMPTGGQPPTHSNLRQVYFAHLRASF